MAPRGPVFVEIAAPAEVAQPLTEVRALTAVNRGPRTLLCRGPRVCVRYVARNDQPSGDYETCQHPVAKD
eukprot:4950037-Prymnesium_polylepis.2